MNTRRHCTAGMPSAIVIEFFPFEPHGNQSVVCGTRLVLRGFPWWHVKCPLAHCQIFLPQKEATRCTWLNPGTAFWRGVEYDVLEEDVRRQFKLKRRGMPDHDQPRCLLEIVWPPWPKVTAFEMQESNSGSEPRLCWTEMRTSWHKWIKRRRGGKF